MQKRKTSRNVHFKDKTSNYHNSEQYQTYNSQDFSSGQEFRSNDPSSYSICPNSLNKNGKYLRNLQKQQSESSSCRHNMNQFNTLNNKQSQQNYQEYTNNFRKKEPRCSPQQQQFYWKLDSEYEQKQSPYFKENIKHKRRRSPNHTSLIQINSRKSNENVQYSNGVIQRLNEIEQITGLQNKNLKQQNNYLKKMIQKLQKNQDKYKNIIQKQKQFNQKLTSENQSLRKKYRQTKNFVQLNIDEIEKAIQFEGISNQLSDTSTSVHHTSIQMTPLNLNKTLQATPQNINRYSQTTNNQSQSNYIYQKQNFDEVSQTKMIEELNDRFDALMFEYKKTNDPTLRKQCIEIAKSIKNQRKLLRNSQKQ